MPLEVSGMMFAGIAALAAGFVLVWGRFRACTGVGRILVLGPVFEAAALAVFSAEHFTAARDLMPIVPRWLPYPLFWTYFVGLCLLAAAVSFIGWRHVPWSASLLALLFLIIVATIDLPNLPRASHNRFFWTLTVREPSFAGGAMVLAGAVWREGARIGEALIAGGRLIVGVVMVFYGIEHFVYPQFVPGVPLEKAVPGWMPAPTLIAYFVGVTLTLAGVCLLVRRAVRIATAVAGSVLLLLTALFYGSILAADFRAGGSNSGLVVEGLNYVFDTMLFAATVLLAGWGREEAFTSR